MKRIAYVLMTWDVILAAAGTHPARTSNLPPDAKVSHVVLDDQSQQARVYFESESLEPVVQGGVIPQFEALLTAHFA